ncbi:MAG TPA: hypothetical protein VIV54_07705 [Burkholderiales bacterium]
MKRSTACSLALALATRGALAADPVGSSNPAHGLPGTTVFAEANAFIGSDFVPATRLFKDDWGRDYAPRQGRNIALVSARAETGASWRGFRASYIYRQEWFAEAHKDSLDAFNADRQDRDFDTGRRYVLDFRLKGFSAEGLRLGKSFSHAVAAGWRLDWGIAGSLLRGSRVRRESVSGTGLATGGRNADATIDWVRDDSNIDTVAKGFAPAFQSGDPRGDGYSADLGLQLTRADGLRFEWMAIDALSRMHWQSIPEMTLSGRTVFAGSLPSGRMIRVDFAETLPIKQSVLASIPFAAGRLELADHYLHGIHFPRLGVASGVPQGIQLRAGYDLRFRAAELGIGYRWLQLGLTTSALPFAKAKTLGVDFAARLAF